MQLLFRNPHSILHVLAPDESGKMTRWAVEWQGATQLGAGGIDAQTLRLGIRLCQGRPGLRSGRAPHPDVLDQAHHGRLRLGTAPGEVVN